jgi:putative transcriptional regulator
MLLVATAELRDPNFDGTVVLLLEVNDEGALGVVLNRPSAVPVAEVLDAWAEHCDEPEVLFQGGPVSADGAMALARLAGDATDSEGFRALHAFDGTVGLLDLDIPAEEFGADLVSLRVFAGYAGWGAEQLREEIGEGSWHVVPALIEDAFREDSTTLRHDVLRRQPGELAWLSTRPANARLN